MVTMLRTVTGSVSDAVGDRRKLPDEIDAQVPRSEAAEATPDFAILSWSSSSTNALSPNSWKDASASVAEPRLTLRTTGASDLVNLFWTG